MHSCFMIEYFSGVDHYGDAEEVERQIRAQFSTRSVEVDVSLWLLGATLTNYFDVFCYLSSHAALPIPSLRR